MIGISHEDTKITKAHEERLVQNMLRVAFVFFVSSWPECAA